MAVIVKERNIMQALLDGFILDVVSCVVYFIIQGEFILSATGFNYSCLIDFEKE